MRCQFCGWENPETKSVCEKCNQPLQQVSPIGKSTVRETGNSQSSDRKTQSMTNENFNPKATVRESGMSKSSVVICPSCGYNVEGENVCPCCGNDVTTSSDAKDTINFKKTVRPDYDNRFSAEPANGFRLVKVSNSGHSVSTVQYDEEEVSLNRDNLDAGNPTITSHVQAVIRKDADRWLITDYSELRSTFVQASRPTEIHNGDMILIGDQLFRFEIN